jgi:hypothetical protein
MATPLNAGKTDLWTNDMTALKNNSSLVSESELKDFIKKHPDQAVIDKLESELAKLQSELKSLMDQAKARTARSRRRRRPSSRPAEAVGRPSLDHSAAVAAAWPVDALAAVAAACRAGSHAPSAAATSANTVPAAKASW